MTVVRQVTRIAAPPETAFDAARDIDIHVKTGEPNGERAVGGVTHGLIGAGEEVTFEASQFGRRWRATFRIVEFDRPHRFVDQMIQGSMPAFRHEHRFEPAEGGTNMIDEITYQPPWGFLGAVLDPLVFRPALRKVLARRAADLRKVLESGAR